MEVIIILFFVTELNATRFKKNSLHLASASTEFMNRQKQHCNKTKIVTFSFTNKKAFQPKANRLLPNRSEGGVTVW